MQETKAINKTVFIVLFLFSELLSIAQVRFYAQVSEGPLLPAHSFQIQYIAEDAHSLEDFEIKDMSGLVLLDSFSHFNKSIDRNGEPTKPGIIRIFVVMAPAEGSIKVPEATARINGRKMTSVSFPIIIGKDPTGHSPGIIVPVDQYSVLYANEETDQKIRGNLFIKAEASKRICVVGEGITVTYKLYSRLNAKSQLVRRPSFNGCSVLDMVDDYDSASKVEIYKGGAYYVNILRKVHLFPLQAGTLHLDYAEVMSTVELIRSNMPAPKNRVGLLFQQPEKNAASLLKRTVNIRSEPFDLKVAGVPVLNQPSDFNGAIGDFQVSLTAEETKVLPRSLVRIYLRVVGKGNFPLLLQPKLKWPQGLDSLGAVSREVYNTDRFPLKGYKEFTFEFSAPDSGRYNFQPVQFSFFDPTTAKYKTVHSKSLQLSVPTNEPSQFLKPVSDTSQGFPLQYFWFAGVLVLVLIVLLHQVITARKEKKQQALLSEILVQQKPEKDYLSAARLSYFSEDYPLFIKELLNAFWMFFEEEWGLDPALHTKDFLQKHMKERNLPIALQEELLSFLKECEWLEYTATAHEIEHYQSFMERSEKLMQAIK